MSATNETTRLILNYLFEHRIFAKRHGVSSGPAQYTDKHGNTKQRYVHAGITGGADIFGWLPPHARGFGIEIKAGRDRLRPEQIGFQRNLELMGGIYLVVHNFEDFVDQWQKIS